MEPGTHQVIHLQASVTAPAQARHALREAAAQVANTDLAETAELLVSELVTNAVRHGSGQVELLIECATDGLAVTVSDDEPNPPVLRHQQLMAEGGRGMLMVDALAGSWGVRPRRSGPGKEVWFRLP